MRVESLWGASRDLVQPADVSAPIAERVLFVILPTSAHAHYTLAFPILPAVLLSLLPTSFSRVALPIA